MQDMEILTQMIKITALVALDGSTGQPRVLLREAQANDSSASISLLPSDAVVIKVDAFRSPDDVFCGTKGECKRSDYVIISEKKKCVVHIELKREKGTWNQIVNQLIGSHCFVKYCQEIGRDYWGSPNFLSGYRHRFISIAHTSVSKKKTRITRSSETHDTPAEAMRIDWPKDIQYNMLAGI